MRPVRAVDMTSAWGFLPFEELKSQRGKNAMCLTTVLMTLLLGVAVPDSEKTVSEDFAKLFESREHRYTGGSYHDETFRYRLFVPHKAKSNKRYPLFVWLHGYGEGGNDNVTQLKLLDLMIQDSSHLDQYPFFVLAVQCPEENPCWYHRAGVERADDMLTVAFDILQFTMHEEAVDPQRVYLVGISGGGSGGWEMAQRHPNLFAAMATLSAGGGDESRAGRLASLPIWVFHNAKDHIEGDASMVSAVKKAGGNIFFTVRNSKSHNSWTTAFEQDHIASWLLSQRRNAWFHWTPPGHYSWQWWHILTVPLAFVIVAWLGSHSEKKRRRRKKLAIARSESKTVEPKQNQSS
jgi:poly(3-hydroxybutyrate) depolymerase